MLYGQEYVNKCKKIAEKWHYTYDNSIMTDEHIDEFNYDCEEAEVSLDDVIYILDKYEI